MIKMSEEEKQFLLKHIDKDIVENGKINDVLYALDDAIVYKGFDKDYFYNDFGKKAQEVYDSIYDQN